MLLNRTPIFAPVDAVPVGSSLFSRQKVLRMFRPLLPVVIAVLVLGLLVGPGHIEALEYFESPTAAEVVARQPSVDFNSQHVLITETVKERRDLTTGNGLLAIPLTPLRLEHGSMSPWPPDRGDAYFLLAAGLAAFIVLVLAFVAGRCHLGRLRREASNAVALRDANDALLKANARLGSELAGATAQLHASERLQYGVLDTLTARIGILDDKGVIIKTNRSWREFAAGNVKFPERAGEGDNYLDICDRVGGKGIKIAALVREVMKGANTERTFKYPCLVANVQCWFMCRIARLKRDGPVCVVIVHENITLHEKAETALRQLNDELEQRVLARTKQLQKAQQGAEQASEAKSQFLATMSHEIRTPLNGVIGVVDVLEQTALDDRQKDMVDLIRLSGLSLLDIIEDILDLSKIEAGHLDLSPVPFSIAAVVEQCCAMLDNQASNKGVELRLYTDPALPEMTIGDELRIRQILLNLISNAIKFSSEQEAGRVSVRAVFESQTEQQLWVLFQVNDNGIGMDTQTQAGLFEAFKQADATTRRRFGGTGLGLAISQHLVNMMQGEIRVHSEPGKGSSFTVKLPLALVAQSEAQLPSPVEGLNCLVVGSPRSLALDLYAYLVHAKSEVAQVPDLAAARKWQQRAGTGLYVWVVDIERQSREIAGFELKAEALPGQEVRYVLIERGRRRQPRLASADRVEVDGNVLTRKTLLAAVTFASGRAALAALRPATPVKSTSQPVPPSRAEALWRGCLILVAEDNRVNQKVLTHQLGLLGYTADIASDGREALQLWRSGEYALLLTDLHMPEMDGYQLTTEIRAEQTEKNRIPIIALTANALKGETERCQVIGMDDFLSKPVRLDVLRAMLEKWMPTGSLSGPSGNTPPIIAQSTTATTAKVEPLCLDTSIPATFVGGDLEIMQELLQDFRHYGRKKAEELLKANEDGDVQAVCAIAHKLKSSAGSIGAMRLNAFCAGLESAARDEDLDAVAKLIPLFRAEIFAVDQAIAAL